MMIFSLLTSFAHSVLFTKCGTPTAQLKNLIELAQSIRASFGDPPDTDKRIDRYLQETWAHQPRKERNELNVPELKETQVEKFYQAFHALGMIDDSNQQIGDPKVIVILGCCYLTLKRRVEFAKKIFEKLKRKPQVILLTGDRLLEKTRQDTILPLDTGAPKKCKTEEDLGKYFKKENSGLSIILINAAKEPHEKRATTASNGKALEAWLKKNKIKGKILLISSELFGPYQLAVMKKNCPVSGVCFYVRSSPPGREFDQILVASGMDALACWIHTERGSS